ncbi:DEAD/DEAH box helicase [Candidatus Parabeggiatoa sp. HSG14]|uniref:DEAD/DEAH box helicase n=1 Tax=Candidatus Parabeggiatoa sp. HSG14 TaxID=3055593 RepID=UPI0025A8D713|nr:DEAD/DEAH box helicase [Thiotrichales bacterium HSG14]
MDTATISEKTLKKHHIPFDGKVEEIARAHFDGGTIVIDNVAQQVETPSPFLWIQGKWRCRAVDYRLIRPWLYELNIHNNVPRWQELPLNLQENWELHPYQIEALNAWTAANHWGSVVLPTGAGKTVLALRAMIQMGVSTLVVVPTIDLLHQWYARLENAFGIPIGVWYGLEKKAQPITVTTYPSAWAHAETLGNLFKLLIFDEIHHLPAPSWHEIALMCVAPYRLGLTATYPHQNNFRPFSSGKSKVTANDQLQLFNAVNPLDPVALLNELVGPVVYQKEINDLTGEQLAEYRTLRVRVDLYEYEKKVYDIAYGTYIGYVRDNHLRETHGSVWWHEFTRRSAFEVEARRAKVAELKWKDIVQQAQGKLDILDQLLREHLQQPMLIFTAHNRFAYRIARQHLIPVITHQTKAAERKAILENYRNGIYRVIVTTKVLNEGIDVPEAKIAVILGGSASDREYVQRLGRVLRKHGNAEAILYEVIVRNTADEKIAERRHPRQ